MANEYKWPPTTIGGFFVDNIDYMGLEFWYEEVKRNAEELEAKKAKNKKK